VGSHPVFEVRRNGFEDVVRHTDENEGVGGTVPRDDEFGTRYVVDGGGEFFHGAGTLNDPSILKTTSPTSPEATASPYLSNCLCISLNFIGLCTNPGH